MKIKRPPQLFMVWALATFISWTTVGPAHSAPLNYKIPAPDIDRIEPEICGKNTYDTSDDQDPILSVCLMVTPRMEISQHPIHVLLVERKSGRTKTYFLLGLSEVSGAEYSADGFVVKSALIDRAGNKVKKSYLYRVYNQLNYITQAQLKYLTGVTPDGQHFTIDVD